MPRQRVFHDAVFRLFLPASTISDPQTFHEALIPGENIINNVLQLSPSPPFSCAMARSRIVAGDVSTECVRRSLHNDLQRSEFLQTLIYGGTEMPPFCHRAWRTGRRGIGLNADDINFRFDGRRIFTRWTRVGVNGN